MRVLNLEYLEILDETGQQGGESYQDIFSINFGNGALVIRDTKNEIYRTSFPLPIAFSAQNIPGIVTSNQSTDGSLKTSFIALAGQGTQGGNQVAVFFSSSSSVLSL